VYAKEASKSDASDAPAVGCPSDAPVVGCASDAPAVGCASDAPAVSCASDVAAPGDDFEGDVSGSNPDGDSKVGVVEHEVVVIKVVISVTDEASGGPDVVAPSANAAEEDASNNPGVDAVEHDVVIVSVDIFVAVLLYGELVSDASLHVEHFVVSVV